MTLLNSPAVGVSVLLPSGGAVPPAALLANGGPLDGVADGVPWDVPFLGQWRQLCVRNDAAQAQRSILVDGFLVQTVPTTALPIPANTAVLLGAGCSVSIPEFIVWDTAVPDAELRLTTVAQRTKWEVPVLKLSPMTRTVVSTKLLPPPVQLPEGLPAPACWLDARDLTSLCQTVSLACVHPGHRPSVTVRARSRRPSTGGCGAGWTAAEGGVTAHSPAPPSWRVPWNRSTSHRSCTCTRRAPCAWTMHAWPPGRLVHDPGGKPIAGRAGCDSGRHRITARTRMRPQPASPWWRCGASARGRMGEGVIPSAQAPSGWHGRTDPSTVHQCRLRAFAVAGDPGSGHRP